MPTPLTNFPADPTGENARISSMGRRWKYSNQGITDSAELSSNFEVIRGWWVAPFTWSLSMKGPEKWIQLSGPFRNARQGIGGHFSQATQSTASSFPVANADFLPIPYHLIVVDSVVWGWLLSLSTISSSISTTTTQIRKYLDSFTGISGRWSTKLSTNNKWFHTSSRINSWYFTRDTGCFGGPVSNKQGPHIQACECYFVVGVVQRECYCVWSAYQSDKAKVKHGQVSIRIITK